MTAPAKTRDELLAEVHGLTHFACDPATACFVLAALDALLAAERERCALECDSFATALDGGDAPISMAATAIACANRLRGLT